MTKRVSNNDLRKLAHDITLKKVFSVDLEKLRCALGELIERREVEQKTAPYNWCEVCEAFVDMEQIPSGASDLTDIVLKCPHCGHIEYM